MLKAEQIPDEVVEALLAHLNMCECRDCNAETIAAALNAWPGMSDIPAGEFDGEHYPRIIHLPLPTEKETSDD